jgi:hypothetical protein
VAAIMPATDTLTGAQDLTEAVVEANKKFKVGSVTADLFAPNDMVVVSQKSGQAQCQCVGMYEVSSIDASNNYVLVAGSGTIVPGCTFGNCRLDKSRGT